MHQSAILFLQSTGFRSILFSVDGVERDQVANKRLLAYAWPAAGLAPERLVVGQQMTNDDERRKKEILAPLLLEAGAALLDCQTFEYGLALLLFHSGRLGAPGIDPEIFRAILDGKSKSTAGNLLRQFRDKFEIRAADLDAALSEAIDARNYIIHRFMIERMERVIEPADRKRVVAELTQLRARIRKADAMIRPVINSFGYALDGHDAEKYEREMLDALFSNEDVQQSPPPYSSPAAGSESGEA